MKYIVEEALFLLSKLELIFPESTKSKLRKMLTEGRVLVDGTPVYNAKELLTKGNEVMIINRSEAMKKSPPPQPKKEISKKPFSYKRSKQTKIIHLCKNLDQCDIDLISKKIIDLGKKKSFPDISFNNE